MKKRNNSERRGMNKTKDFTLQFLPYAEIKDLDSNNRIRRILEIIREDTILILQGKLKPEEESKLIKDTMNLIRGFESFKGVELAIVSNYSDKGLIDKIKRNIVNLLYGGDLDVITIIGPATIVKEIKKNPKKIELFLKK